MTLATTESTITDHEAASPGTGTAVMSERGPGVTPTSPASNSVTQRSQLEGSSQSP